MVGPLWGAVPGVPGKFVECYLMPRARAIFVQRHRAGMGEHAPPRAVDYAATASFLAAAGCVDAICLGSVGSLSAHYFPKGTVVVPTDYFAIHSVFAGSKHLAPTLHQARRTHWTTILAPFAPPNPLPPNTPIVYYQTQGPRFETQAEIRSLTTERGPPPYAVVGMTLAAEATSLLEVSLHVTLVAIVDNLANGVSEVEPGHQGGGAVDDAFYQGVQDNRHLSARVFDTIVEGLASRATDKSTATK